ncbi:uncharacterized protein LOC131436933 [Malaya genurostris]|uniref:uncharacterized protein LOC131436933 n=1 Tax=Malaya genurostris TaxID=325434 RepID=UPI0026F3B665|nr:uncharacterized protein LOC131436933 [Malaya genurostris]
MLIVLTVVHHLITSLNLKHNLNSKHSINESIFDMISIFLNQGVFSNSVFSSYRVLISFILLSGVVLSNTYASGLASVLTIPRYGKPLETIHDFVESPYRWGASSLAWILSLESADTHDIRELVARFDMIPDEEELFRRSLGGDYGLAIEFLNSGYYAYLSFVRQENVQLFDILKQELYFMYTIAYSQRGWPLMEYFNKFNLETIQHGFILHWEKQMIR